MLLSVALMICCASVSAQTLRTEEVPPPPAADYFPQRWKEYTSEDGGFRLLFPAAPKESSQTHEIPGGNVVARTVSHESFIRYTLMYTTYPHDVEQASKDKGFMDRVRDGSLAAVAEGRPRVVREADVSVAGHAGRFLQVELADGTVVRMKWVACRTKLYVISVTTPKGRAGAMGAENDYEKIAMSFLDSFRLVDPQSDA